MKINDNGIIREMTEEEISEMQKMTQPTIKQEEDISKKIERIELGINEILSLLSNK